MTSIKVTEALINGVKYDTKEMPSYSEEYQVLSKEADETIKENFKQYRKTYQKSKKNNM